MKQFKILLLFLFIALYSAGQIPKGKSKNNKIDSSTLVASKGISKGTTKNTKFGVKEGNGVLLVYTGTMSGDMNLDIGIHVEIDTLIGLRCDIVFGSGSNVMSHIGVFYKFSSPYQTIYFNFLTHSSTVNNGEGSNNTQRVAVVDSGVVNSFQCAHLKDLMKSDNEMNDYWMSKDVPGFSKLINTLGSISSDLPGMAINGDIFQWGGLVEWTYHYQKSGKKINVKIDLTEHNSTMNFPASDFDVPSK